MEGYQKYNQYLRLLNIHAAVHNDNNDDDDIWYDNDDDSREEEYLEKFSVSWLCCRDSEGGSP